MMFILQERSPLKISCHESPLLPGQVEEESAKENLKRRLQTSITSQTLFKIRSNLFSYNWQAKRAPGQGRSR